MMETSTFLNPATHMAASNECYLLPFQDATTTESLAALVAIMTFIRYSRVFLLEPMLRNIGHLAGEYTHGPKWPAQNQQKLDNFSDFSFRFLYRCVVTALGLIEFWQSPEWWLDTRQLWEGYPNHFVSNTVQLLYLLQLAYHIEDLGTVLIQGSSNRKDFKAMLLHHCVTALLLFGSSFYHATRIGCIVSTLHAITDVPKDFAKSAKQLEWKRASHVAFAVFVLSWIVCRMILYPFVYVRSTYTESSALHDGGMSVQSLNCFIALLSILCLLNLFWFGMMVKLVCDLLANGDAEDPSVKANKEEESAWVVTKNEDDDDDASDISDGTSTTYNESDTHDGDNSLDDQ